MIASVLYGVILFFIAASVVLLGLSKRRSIIVYLLMASLLLGPRIPLRQLTDMQRLDLRLDDLIIVLMFIIAGTLLILKRTKPAYPPYMRYLILFIIVSLASSVYAVGYGGLPLDSALLYWGKEFSYISLCFTIPLFITNKHEMTTLLKVVCGAMAVNIAWLFYQIVTNTKGQLINFIDYTPSYGFTLVGDFPAFQVASVYSYALILFLIVFFSYKKKYSLLVLILGSFVGLLATLSRSFIASTVVVIALMSIYLVFRKKALSAKNLALIIIFVAAAVLAGLWTYSYLKSNEFPIFRLEASETRHALADVRKTGIWQPLWYSFLERPVLGHGKGSVSEILSDFDEAHNYYLRLLVETGVPGTAFFVLFLAYLLGASFNLVKHAQSKEVYIIALNMIMITLVLCIVSFGQDGFYSSKLAIPFYVNAGLLNLIYMKRKTVQHSKAAYGGYSYIPAGNPAAARERQAYPRPETVSTE